jgi:serine/threonine-protein kinase
MLVLAGRYRLLNRLGRGGTSFRWRGYDQVLDRTVAVTLLAGGATDAAARELARAEARTAIQLSHPHICQVYDYGESRTESGDQVAYVVTELLSGPTLEERLRAGDLPAPEALRVCAQVASALAAAHGCGLVHRGIKPANIMLTAAGPKVVDLGVSAGRPGVGKAKPASDVYALGLLVHRLVSEPAPEDGLPEPVADLCQRCLAEDPRRRPTAHEVARRLAEAIGWHVSRAGEELTQAPPGAVATLAAPPAPPAEATAAAPGIERRPPAPGGSTHEPLRLQVKRHHRRRPVLLAAIAVLLTVAGVTGGIWMASGPPPDRYESVVVAEPEEPPADSPATHPAGAGSPAPLPSPSPDGGPTGPTRTEGGGEPREVPGSSSPAPPGGVETPGGTILARCVGSAASVEPLDLAPGFRVVEQTRGPGVVRAGIVLGSSEREVRVHVRCRADTPVSTVRVSRTPRELSGYGGG